MNHEVLILCFTLATIPILWLSMSWIKSPIMDDAFWKRREEAQFKRIMAGLPYSVHLWKKLFESVRDNKPEHEQNKCAQDVYDYLRLLAQ